MKARQLIPVLVVVALFFTGCQTVNDRIAEKPAVFAMLDAATQKNIRHHRYETGYTEDMVYLALGRPDQQSESSDASGHYTFWSYKVDGAVPATNTAPDVWRSDSPYSNRYTPADQPRTVDGGSTFISEPRLDLPVTYHNDQLENRPVSPGSGFYTIVFKDGGVMPPEELTAYYKKVAARLQVAGEPTPAGSH